MSANRSLPTNHFKVIITSVTLLNAIALICCPENAQLEKKIEERRPAARVLHGENAKQTEYPFVVALEVSRGSYIRRLNITKHRVCTGSLINEHFVLSAAHCFKADRIRYGDLTLPSTATGVYYSNILKKMTHHNRHSDILRESAYYYIRADIALYRVEPVHLQKYGRLSAVDYLTMIGCPVHYVGLGRTYPNKVIPKPKRVIKDQVRERQIGYAVIKRCDKIKSGKIFPIICIAKKCGSKQDTSKGDSGGPLFYDGKIAGVCFGKVVAMGKLQTVFTPVSVYMDWIRTVMHI